MNILIISHSFYPSSEPRANRWTEIAKNFQKNGHQIKVITSSSSRKLLKTFKIEGLEVLEVYDPLFKYTKNVLKIPKNTPTINNRNPIKFIFKFIYKYKWPDYAFLWIPFGLYFGMKLIKKYNFDLIISVSNPFSSHVIALLLKKKNSLWIADYGDPFSFEKIYPSNNQKIYNKLNSSVEKLVIKKSNFITLTNENVKHEFLNFFNSNKYFIIPPFFNIINITNNYIKNNIYLDNNKINIVYSGTLYSKIRNPLNFVEFIKRVNLNLDKKIVIHFFGNIGDCNFLLNYNSDLIKIHGGVSLPELILIIKKSTFLLNIGNKSTYQLPSKIFEYMISQKPIINLIYDTTDLTIPILEKYNASFNIINTKIYMNANEKEIIKFLLYPSKVDTKYLKDITDKFSIESVSNMYLNLAS
jgi:glycosyltransferase involved in cell wall biosynthesis